MRMPETAMVLAAGFGKRMLPLTATIPKPLIDFRGKALIDWTLENLQEQGIKRIVVNVHYLADKIIDHIAQNWNLTGVWRGDALSWANNDSMEIIISYESEILETAGGVINALPLLPKDEPFFVMASDVVWRSGARPVLQNMAENWSDDLKSLLLLKSTTGANSYDGLGDFFLDQLGRVRFRKESEVAPFVFSTIQLVSPKLFENLDSGFRPLTSIYRNMSGDDGWLKEIEALRHDGAWLDIGSAKTLHKLQSWNY